MSKAMQAARLRVSAGVGCIYVVQHTARVENCARRLLWVVN